MNHPPRPPRPRSGIEKVPALILAAVCATHASAQQVAGTIRSATDRTPVTGAIVILAAQSGAKVTATLTSDSGTFRLQAPAAGRFSLRVDVVGYESVTVPPFQLDSGTVTRDVLFPFARVRLPAVAITASTACARVSEDAGDAPRLWSEARKALEATRLAIEEQRFMIALRRFERTIGPDSVLRESRTWTQTGVTQNPFETLSPVTVARSGFRVARDTSELYYGPDAAVLLSDAFVEGHCFGTRHGGPSGAVGLTFRPQRVGPITDISGVLWLDSATAELRTLEYRYVPSIGDPNVAGGIVGFGRLPSGVWGVQRWSIRLPVLRVTESSRRPDGALGRFVDTMTVAVREVGGEVITGGSSSGTSADGRLIGTVYDSTLGAPLGGASITIEGLGRNAVTDATGSFAIDSLSEDGEFRIRFWHPRLDSLGLAAPVSRHRLRRRGENVASLAVPGVGVIARDRCGRNTSGAERVIMGTLRSADDSTRPVPSTDIVLLERRGTMTTGGDSLVRHNGITSDLGRYAFCGVASGSQAWLVARVGTEWTEPQLVHGERARPVEIVPLRGPSLVPTHPDSSPPGAPAVILGRTLTSDASSRLSGWVLLPEHSEASVEVLVDNAVRASVSKDGSFRVDRLLPGARRVTFRGPRLAVRHVVVSAEPGQSHVLLVTLREAPLVVVRRASPAFDQRMAEFRQRRRVGNGIFLERSEIEKRNPRTLTDLLRTVPGIRIVSTGSGHRYVSSHFRRLAEGAPGPESAMCDLMFYLDGQPFPMESGDADGRIRVSEIAALEVYLSAGSVPRQFAGVNAACGVIMLWRG